MTFLKPGLLRKIWVEDTNIVDITYTPAFDVVMRRDMVRITDNWLPDSEIIISALGAIIKAFEDTVQVGLMRTRWNEIKKLQSNQTLIA